MSTTPMQVVLTFEADNNTSFGALADKMMADPSFVSLMHDVNSEDSPVASSVTASWVEV